MSDEKKRKKWIEGEQPKELLNKKTASRTIQLQEVEVAEPEQRKELRVHL